MFTQVYVRAQEILGFLSGFTESPSLLESTTAATAEKRGRGSGRNEKQRTEVDSEQLKSQADLSPSVSHSESLFLFAFVTLSLSQTHTQDYRRACRAHARTRTCAHTHVRRRSNDLRLLAQFVPFLGYFCSRQIRFPVITTPFHLPVLNHRRTTAKRACTRLQTSTARCSQNTASTQTGRGVHAHQQAWITLELFEEWGGDEAYFAKPFVTSRTVLFLPANRCPSIIHKRERRNAESRGAAARTETCGGLPRQTDRQSVSETDRQRKAAWTDSKRVYQPISTAPLSLCQPAWPSCVHTLVPCCLTGAACWMFQEH